MSFRLTVTIALDGLDSVQRGTLVNRVSDIVDLCLTKGLTLFIAIDNEEDDEREAPTANGNPSAPRQGG